MKKKMKSWALLLGLMAALILAGGLTQWYLKDNLVVAVKEAHSHAHAGEEADHEHASESGSKISADVNLVRNFGFEVGTGFDFYGWEAEGEDPGTSVWRDIDVSANGFSSAALLSSDSSRGVDLALTQSLEVVPAGMDVTISGFVKTEELHGNAFLRVTGSIEYEQTTRLLAWLSLDEVSGNTDWKKIQGTVYLPPEVNAAKVSVGIFGDGKAWFDEVFLTASERNQVPLARDVNLLENPGFSQSTLFWHFFSTPDTPKVAWDTGNGGGGFDPCLILTQADPAGEDNFSGFFQVINDLNRIEDSVTLGGWIRTVDLEGEAWLNLTFYCTDGRIMAETTSRPSGTTDWQYLEMTVQVPSNADSVWIRLMTRGKGTACFDDLWFSLSAGQ